MFSEEFKDQFIQKMITDPSEHLFALGLFGFIVAVLAIGTSLWVSKRLMITYIYLKTGNLLKSSDDLSKIRDEFKRHNN